MKLLSQVFVLFLLSFAHLSIAQDLAPLPEDFSIVIRPMVDNTTGLDDSTCQEIETKLIKLLGDKFVVSEFSSFPYAIVARCFAENHKVGLGEDSGFELELNMTLYLIDFISKQSFGSKNFTLPGGGRSKKEALLMALDQITKQKESINSFVESAYMSLLMCYETNCNENMDKFRESSPTSMPEDLLVNLMSIPAMVPDCKMRANEELRMMYMDYCGRKCEELNSILDFAIEQKDKKQIEEIYTKMSFLYNCEEQMEMRKEKLKKMKIPVDAILAKAKKYKFDVMEIDASLLASKITKVLIEMREKELEQDPAIINMKMEDLRQILEKE